MGFVIFLKLPSKMVFCAALTSLVFCVLKNLDIVFAARNVLRGVDDPVSIEDEAVVENDSLSDADASGTSLGGGGGPFPFNFLVSVGEENERGRSTPSYRSPASSVSVDARGDVLSDGTLSDSSAAEVDSELIISDLLLSESLLPTTESRTISAGKSVAEIKTSSLKTGIHLSPAAGGERLSPAAGGGRWRTEPNSATLLGMLVILILCSRTKIGREVGWGSEVGGRWGGVRGGSGRGGVVGGGRVWWEEGGRNPYFRPWTGIRMTIVLSA